MTILTKPGKSSKKAEIIKVPLVEVRTEVRILSNTLFVFFKFWISKFNVHQNKKIFCCSIVLKE